MKKSILKDKSEIIVTFHKLFETLPLHLLKMSVHCFHPCHYTEWLKMPVNLLEKKIISYKVKFVLHITLKKINFKIKHVCIYKNICDKFVLIMIIPLRLLLHHVSLVWGCKFMKAVLKMLAEWYKFFKAVLSLNFW